MKKIVKKVIKVQDRKLGDEWQDWKGRLLISEENANTGKRIFLGILLIAILFFGILGLFIWYLITPRLLQFHPLLPLIVGLNMAAAWLFFGIWFFIMILSILTGKDYFMRFAGKEIPITYFVPLVLRFGRRLGISRDRLSNSFVKVSNMLIRSKAKKIRPEELLILLPRCLQKQMIQKITSFAKALKIQIFTVGGGEAARRIVSQKNPQAIIGVACERDLLTGIQDVINKVPVIGIPNKRPEGPCKNTTVDLVEFERAVQTFLGPHVHLTS